MSIRQACKAVKLPRSTYDYKFSEGDDLEIIRSLNDLVDKHPSIGFWKCYHRLRRQGKNWNHKRVYRIYTQMQLNIRRKAKDGFLQGLNKPCFNLGVSIRSGRLISCVIAYGMVASSDCLTFWMIITVKSLPLKWTLRYRHFG